MDYPCCPLKSLYSCGCIEYTHSRRCEEAGQPMDDDTPCGAYPNSSQTAIFDCECDGHLEKTLPRERIIETSYPGDNISFDSRFLCLKLDKLIRSCEANTAEVKANTAEIKAVATEIKVVAAEVKIVADSVNTNTDIVTSGTERIIDAFEEGNIRAGSGTLTPATTIHSLDVNNNGTVSASTTIDNLKKVSAKIQTLPIASGLSKLQSDVEMNQKVFQTIVKQHLAKLDVSVSVREKLERDMVVSWTFLERGIENSFQKAEKTILKASEDGAMMLLDSLT